jgi:Thermophilic metalloprotease (M29)
VAENGWTQNLIAALRLEPGERVAIVMDEPLAREADEFAAAARDLGAEPEVRIWKGERPLAHAPEDILDAATRADVALHIQQAPWGEEAAARFELLEAVTGHDGRMIFMGLVDGELLRGELSQPAPNLADKAQTLLTALEGAKEIHVRAPGGTDLVLGVEGRPFHTDALPLEPGQMANYPGGEVFCSPLETEANGVLVADLTVPYTVEGLVDEPVRITFEGGRVTAIEGGEAAALLRKLVDDAGQGADVIAELGIGFYPGLEPRGHVMLDEKAAGTAHVAIGRNTGVYGGVNDATIHVDCVFSAPAFEVDGAPLPLP